jgi:hypothetical protein
MTFEDLILEMQEREAKEAKEAAKKAGKQKPIKT